jgi:hypothetical protein
MSYHVTILRILKGKQVPIDLDEVMAAAGEMGAWQYTASPPTFEHRGEEGTSTLWYQDGELLGKNPELWTLELMLALANKLDARVRGDEYETYRTADNTFFHPDDRALRKKDEAHSKTLLAQSMREQRLIRNVIVGFFLVLGGIGYAIGKWFETHSRQLPLLHAANGRCDFEDALNNLLLPH